MVLKKKLPSVEDLHEWFSCDFDTGRLYWKNPRGTRVKAGDPVYIDNSRNYSTVTLQCNYKRHVFLVHRIVWKMYYREDPGQQELDHIDGNSLNNAISNLRVATPTQNQHNRHCKGFKRNSSWKDRHCSAGGWEVVVGQGGKQKYIGIYPCPLLARLAYIDAKRQIAKEFSPV